MTGEITSGKNKDFHSPEVFSEKPYYHIHILNDGEWNLHIKVNE